MKIHSFAKQLLHENNTKILVDSQPILEYEGEPNYKIKPLQNFLVTQPRKDMLEPKIKPITKYSQLLKLGFILRKRPLDEGERAFSKQRIKFYLVKDDGEKHLGKFPSYTQLFVEYDSANRRARLIGRSGSPSGMPLGKGKWIYLDDHKPKRVTNKGDMATNARAILDRIYDRMAGIDEKPKRIDIPELPVMVTEEGEIVCIPQTLDEPTIGIVGQRRAGKSWLLHGIADRAYWKPEWNRFIGVLNDRRMETETWCVPWLPKDREELLGLSKLGEETRPLPTIYIHPNTDTLSYMLHEKEVGFKISFPFEEIVENHFNYFRLDKSTVYYRNIKDFLKSCKNEDEVIGVLTENIKEVGGRQKIGANFSNLFRQKILDVNTGIASKWRIVGGKIDGEFNPLIACMLAGAVPVLVTNNLLTKEYHPQYFKYYVGEIMQKHSEDPRFKKFRTWLFVDEILDFGSTEKKTVASELLQLLVTGGGPLRIGMVMATQNYTKIVHRLRTNIKYWFVFQNPGEANDIGKDYSLSRDIINEIKTLKKFETMGITTEEFIIYDSEGNRTKTTEPIRGYALPPLSRHKPP